MAPSMPQASCEAQKLDAQLKVNSWCLTASLGSCQNVCASGSSCARAFFQSFTEESDVDFPLLLSIKQNK